MSALTRSMALVAHQGGWDEILLIAGPILAIVGLLVIAKRRVDAAARTDAAPTAGGDDHGGGERDPARSM